MRGCGTSAERGRGEGASRGWQSCAATAGSAPAPRGLILPRSTRRVHHPVQCVCTQQDDVPLQRGVERPRPSPCPTARWLTLTAIWNLFHVSLLASRPGRLNSILFRSTGYPGGTVALRREPGPPQPRGPALPRGHRGAPRHPGEEGGAQGGGTEGNEGLALWQEHPMCHTIAASPRLQSQSPRAAAQRPVPFSAPLQVPPHSPHCLTAARGDSACQDRQLWQGTQSRAGHCTCVGAGQDCAR